jgi:acetylornithine/succinyldiaminopimelate/putrescine aminotransferase
MQALADHPVLGHITTFGGHPVSCVAGKAAMEALLDERMIESVFEKEQLFLSLLKHQAIKAVRSKGLMIAIELESFELVKNVIAACIGKNAFQKPGEPSIHQVNNDFATSVFTDWFLFAPNCIRIVPPLMISAQQIQQACNILLSAIDQCIRKD